MKNSKVCPKCEAADIVAVPRRVASYGTGGDIDVGVKLGGMVDVTRYLCCGCGFSEEWFDDPKDLLKIMKKFGRS
jgi:hypothetical protein